MGRSLGAGGAGGALQAIAPTKKGRKSVRRTHGGIIRFFIELGRRKIRGELKEEKGGVGGPMIKVSKQTVNRIYVLDDKRECDGYIERRRC